MYFLKTPCSVFTLLQQHPSTQTQRHQPTPMQGANPFATLVKSSFHDLLRNILPHFQHFKTLKSTLADRPVIGNKTHISIHSPDDPDLLRVHSVIIFCHNITIKYRLYLRGAARAVFKPGTLELLGAGSNHSAVMLWCTKHFFLLSTFLRNFFLCQDC